MFSVVLSPFLENQTLQTKTELKNKKMFLGTDYVKIIGFISGLETIQPKDKCKSLKNETATCSLSNVVINKTKIL